LKSYGNPNNLPLIPSPLDYLQISNILVQFIERTTISCVIHYTVGQLRRYNLFITNYPNLPLIPTLVRGIWFYNSKRIAII